MFKVHKKALLLILPVTSVLASNAKWQDFENNVYIGGAYSNNNATISQFGTASNSSGAADIGANILFNSKVYLNVEGNGNFNSGGSFAGNWYNLGVKAGYSFQTDHFNFIPYGIIGYGNEGAYYSTTTNTNYGVGLLSEYMITPDWLLYVDLNYQWQSFGGGLNSNFNQNVLNNYSTYNLSGTPSTYGVGIGAKYITKSGFYFNPFFKFQSYQQTFSNSGGGINYGTLNPSVNEYQFGINIGLLI